MSTFCIIMNWPWSYDDTEEKAKAVFDEIVRGATGSPPPYALEVVRVRSPKLEGNAVIIYLDSDFSGVPKELGSYNFYEDLIPWLKSVTQTKWSEDFAGPRDYSLDRYWSPLEILERQHIMPESNP